MTLVTWCSHIPGLPKPAIVSWAKATIAGKFAAAYIPISPEDTFYTVSLNRSSFAMNVLTSSSVCHFITPLALFLDA